MKKLSLILAVILCVLSFSVTAFADDLPVYSLDKPAVATGTVDSPFSFAVIEKESGTIKNMVYVGKEQTFNPGLDCYVAEGDYAQYPYCFISMKADGNGLMHPANNADPAYCFTAPNSGKITIKYVCYGGATTRLEFYKNEYSSAAKFAEHTNAQATEGGTDFEAEVEVKKGDKVYMALDCIDNNASDQTNAWLNSVTYTRVDADPVEPETPDTADFVGVSAVVLAISAIALGAVCASKKH